MRLAFQPGRGGRGHPSLPKPKYMQHAYIKTSITYGNTKLSKIDEQQAKLDEKDERAKVFDSQNLQGQHSKKPKKMMTKICEGSIQSTNGSE